MNANSKLNELEKRLPSKHQLPSDITDDEVMNANEVLYHLTLIGRGQLGGVDLSIRIRALEALAKYHNLTNTTQIKTWKDDAVEAIRKGEIDYQGFMKMFNDESLAHQLFMQAGIPIDDTDPSLDT